mgnify:FL=1|jgi:hypothetical protein
MDIINEYHKKHRIDRECAGYVMRSPIPKIVCKDGFSISVQASEYAYCCPRKTSNISYYEFECGYPSADVPTLREWKEGDGPDTDTVYGYVPVDVIVALIESHGGIADGDASDKCTAPAMGNERG